MSRLAGHAAIVTGGALGIGGATSRRLAEEGASVLIADVDTDAAQANTDPTPKISTRASLSKFLLLRLYPSAAQSSFP